MWNTKHFDSSQFDHAKRPKYSQDSNHNNDNAYLRHYDYRPHNISSKSFQSRNVSFSSSSTLSQSKNFSFQNEPRPDVNSNERYPHITNLKISVENVRKRSNSSFIKETPKKMRIICDKDSILEDEPQARPFLMTQKQKFPKSNKFKNRRKSRRRKRNFSSVNHQASNCSKGQSAHNSETHSLTSRNYLQNERDRTRQRTHQFTTSHESAPEENPSSRQRTHRFTTSHETAPEENPSSRQRTHRFTTSHESAPEENPSSRQRTHRFTTSHETAPEENHSSRQRTHRFTTSHESAPEENPSSKQRTHRFTASHESAPEENPSSRQRTHRFTTSHETAPEENPSSRQRTHRFTTSHESAPEENHYSRQRTHRFTTSHKSSPGENHSSVNSRIRVMGYKDLKELITKEPNEILLTLCLPESGFAQLLNTIGDRRELTTVILIALGKACESVHKQNLMHLLDIVTKNSIFMLCSVQQYLVNFQSDGVDDLDFQSLEKLIHFLNSYNELSPALACETLSIILPLLKLTCQSMKLTHPDLSESTTKKVADLEFRKDSFVSEHCNMHISSVSNTEEIRVVRPPENFRTISILPNNNDIWNDRPFLRPNIINGKYFDTNHYLDVHFRLLREDYIRPLRRGIETYLRLKEQKKSLKMCKEGKIYLNVHIMKQEFVKGIPVHLVSFDIKEFRNINWEFSKRFLSGSLVCLSHNDFQSPYFASVAFRDVKRLTEGILMLKFEDLSDDVLSFTSAQTFVMIETDAYFEAYRHNLSALQEIPNDEFPFSKYIIDVSKDIGAPSYLNKETKFDMGALLQPLNDSANRLNTNKSVVMPIAVLNDEQWPSAKELHLDKSQYQALKTAITKEFTVIQGPPGTGKTYVGLRIVQLLLHNIYSWSPIEQPCPILIVCYTNHALDQFLEGVLSFTDDVIRVGGRCSSDILSKYQLDSRRKSLQNKREVPYYIFSNIRRKNCKLHKMGKTMNQLQNELEISVKRLVSIQKLKEYMNVLHHTSLKEPNSELGNKQLYKWLDLDVSQFSSSSEDNHTQYYQSEKTSTFSSAHNFNEEEHEGNMADVQYLENMRGITDEEIFEIHVDRKLEIENEEASIFEEEKLQQEEYNKLEEYAIKKLKYIFPMVKREVKGIKDVWMLPCQDRWSLYKYWLDLYVRIRQGRLLHLQQEIRIKYQETNEMKMEESLHILRDAKVVGMTTTGAAKYRKMVQHLNPRIVIVEEAAEILESHVVTSLASGTQQIILIGDHQQLRPCPNVYDLSTKYNLDVSLFERMVKNGIEFKQLSIQHRMRPSIASLLVPHIYKNLENHESVFKYENIRGVSKNLFFVTHTSTENQESDSKSRVNGYEANFIASLCRYFVLQGYVSSQITVLTTYSGQLFLLRRLIRTNPLLQEVKITVVDNFQGEENDIILLSFVRSNEEGNIGFLSTVNRVCVALSRARKGLFAIGNFTLLAENSKLWKSMLASLKRQDAIGPSLSLTCQNHPQVITKVSKGSDFEKVIEGGCTQLCAYRLDCGHTCTRRCHAYDSAHEKVNCRKRCEKTCKNNHRCTKLCYEDCGPCEVLMEKEIPGCKHVVPVPCHQSADTFLCTARCEKKLLCNHSCKRLCGQTCTRRCYELVSTKLACDHDRPLYCCSISNKDEFLKLCKAECNSELQCGHLCSGTCGSCHQGRLHQRCPEPCSRILVCGHECQAKCLLSCPPCSKKCENQCEHSQCPRKCGDPCAMCKEPCRRSCKHQKCGKYCGELCDRKPCNVPCTKTLKCGHKCIGLCGERCPKLCGVCNPEVKDIFFGTEDSKDARFVELEDCGHLFEVEALTRWVEMTETQKSEIQMKACPKCKTVIRKSLRFGNIIKTCLADIKKVKLFFFGEPASNEKKLHLLIERLNMLKISKKFNSLLSPLFESLIKNKIMDLNTLIRSEHIIDMMEDYILIEEYLYSRKQSIAEQCKLDQLFRQIENFSCLSCEFIEQFIFKEHSVASDPQLEELSWEIDRLKQIKRFFEFFTAQYSTLQEDKKTICQQLIDHLCKLGPFRLADKQQFNLLFNKINPAAIINVSDAEKKSILKAMKLNKGHWYTCPNGHVYCIGECGGAMEKSKCSECGATIGGERHALREDNRLANDMDGATHSAWPQTRELRNYEEAFN